MSDETTTPDALTISGVFSMVADLRRELTQYKERLVRLEKPHEDIILTINSHDNRLDRHDERLDKLDSVVKSTETWMSGIAHSVSETNVLVKHLLALTEKAKP